MSTGNRFLSSKQRVTPSYIGFTCVCLLCGVIPCLSIQVHFILQKYFSCSKISVLNLSASSLVTETLKNNALWWRHKLWYKLTDVLGKHTTSSIRVGRGNPEEEASTFLKRNVEYVPDYKWHSPNDSVLCNRCSEDQSVPNKVCCVCNFKLISTVDASVFRVASSAI